MELLLGCGYSSDKRLFPDGNNSWKELIRVDINPDVEPDLVWDLNQIPLPFDDNSADEIHAYNILEHLGSQGDYKFLFAQFEDFWRILKPGGLLCATVPVWNTLWALGDPGHTRIINDGTITFFCQEYYEECGKTMRTDYRNVYKGNFKIDYCQVDTTDTFIFVLKAIK